MGMDFALKRFAFSCPNADCLDHGKRGQGNIVIQSKYGKGQAKLLKCKTCKSRFSERRAGFAYGLHTGDGKIKEVIEYLLQGMSYREAASAADLDKDTVQRIWKRFMLCCEESMNSILDELNLQLEDFICLLSQKLRKGKEKPVTAK